MYNLNKLQWREKLNHYETYYNAELPNGIQLACGIEWDNGCEVNLMIVDGNKISNSAFVNHWPVLDQLFGREHWQKFLAEKQAEAKLELELD